MWNIVRLLPVQRFAGTQSVLLASDDGLHRAVLTFAATEGLPLVSVQASDAMGGENHAPDYFLNLGTEVAPALTLHRLAQLPVGDCQRAIRARLGRMNEAVENYGGTVDKVAGRLVDSHAGDPLLAVSLAYVAALDVDSTRPNVLAGEALGWSTQKVTETVRRARLRGYLTDPPRRRGMAGGSLTAKARRLVAPVAVESSSRS